MPKPIIFPFWELNKRSEIRPAPKLPKNLRKRGKLQDRIRNSIKINKETGEYETR